jgi:hypothetical protein
MFRPETFKENKNKLYNKLAPPALLNGRENWTIKATEARITTAAEMKYIRKAEYTWTDYKTNTEIAKELNTTPVLDKIQEY